jgi:hypothetical protein
VQQSGAAPAAVQATPSVRAQAALGAARQVPDWQVVPAQHSALDAQGWAAGWQQRPA